MLCPFCFVSISPDFVFFVLRCVCFVVVVSNVCSRGVLACFCFRVVLVVLFVNVCCVVVVCLCVCFVLYRGFVVRALFVVVLFVFVL